MFSRQKQQQAYKAIGIAQSNFECNIYYVFFLFNLTMEYICGIYIEGR